MADPVTDFVTATVTVDSVGPSQAGFGTLAILTHDAPWTDRARVYGATADASADGFASDHPVYRCLTRVLSQTPKPPTVAVIRTTSPVQVESTIGVNSVLNNTVYNLDLKGQDGFADQVASYTSDGTATNDEITAGLVAAINGLTGRTFTAEQTGTTGSTKLQIVADAAYTFTPFTFTASSSNSQATATAHGLQTGDGPVQLTSSGSLPTGLATLTNYWIIKVDADHFQFAASRAAARAGTAITLTSNGTGTQTCSPASARRLAANKWFACYVENRALLSHVQAAAAPSGLSADLDAIALAYSDWFGVVTPYGGSAAYNLAVSAWIEANSRMYFADTADSGCETDAYSGGTDCGKQIDAAGGKATVCVYHADPASFCGAAAFGQWLATVPGAAVPNVKQLVGVAPLALSGTARANIFARHASTFYKAKGIAVFTDGEVPNRTYRYADVTRNLYWLADALQTAVFGLLAGSPVVPYTQAGIQRVESTVRGVAEGTAVPQGVLAGGAQGPVVTAPDISAVSATDKSNRTLNNVKLAGTLQGAIYKVPLVINVVF